MKKKLFLSAAFLLSLCTLSLSYAEASNSTVTLDPVTVPANSQVNFILTKNQNSLQQQVDYNLTCSTSANDDAMMMFQAFGNGNGYVSWSTMTVNGETVSKQFMLPKNATIQITGLHFTLHEDTKGPGYFPIHNLDVENDVTISCSATPSV